MIDAGEHQVWLLFYQFKQGQLHAVGRGAAAGLSVLSNTQVLFAHLMGLLFSLWLLQRIYRTS